MKMELGAVLAVALLLAGCASPKPDAKQAADGQSDSAQVAAADQPKKKRCNEQTGSRLAPCGQGTDAVTGTSGDSYQQNAIRGGSFVANPNGFGAGTPTGRPQ